MESINIAILGCGTVGGGVAKILTEMGHELDAKASARVVLKRIVDLSPKTASERFNIPIDLFAGGGKELQPDEASAFIREVINSDDIDLIVETIGGTGDMVFGTCLNIVKAGKHLVTANKALLAERGLEIFKTADEKGVKVGFEAAVCGAIPIIKSIRESFTGDQINSISGIMNGTSNYILSRMQNENLTFGEALKKAQEYGYAEADPSLDINGGDAGHKILLLIKLAFGIDVSMDDLSIMGIENITRADMDFAREIDASIKLICYAKRMNGNIYATVRPMMVKNSNFLSNVNDATNAVRLNNQYSGVHILVGEGAGSSETAMSIVSDIVFIARYDTAIRNFTVEKESRFIDSGKFVFPYLISFHTNDIPGTTGYITTVIGQHHINIDTVGHNRHSGKEAVFSVATMPSTLEQIETAIHKIVTEWPGMLLSDPKIMPILY